MPQISHIRSLIRPILWESDLESHPDLYCPGIFAYDWENGSHLDPIEPGSYEIRLEQFFSRDPGLAGQDPDNIMILVGGIGTGKSTSVKRSLERASRTARRCSRCDGGRCAVNPRRIILDFRRKGSSTDPLNPDVEIEETSADEFWAHVQHCLEENLLAFSPSEEYGPFWQWCLTHSSLLELSPTLSSELNSVRAKIEFLIGDKEDFLGWDRPQVLQGLQGAKERLYAEKLTPEERAWYSAFRLAYLHRGNTRTCRCAYLFLDNVDHLSPNLQRIAVDVAARLSELIPARTLIAVRPLTWERSFHGHYLINSERHRSPSLHEVVAKRVEYFLSQRKADLPVGANTAIRSLQRSFGGRNPLLKRLVEATAGLSVRWALRNFYNLLESPVVDLLPPGIDGAEKMQISDLVRAYIQGERSGPIPQSFDNLYAIQGNADEARWLVKPRILETMLQRGLSEVRVRDVHAILWRFGCESELFLLALNELLVRKRPLIWCNLGAKIADYTSPGRVSLTPIGRGYIQNLFGEVFYDEHMLPWGHVAGKGPQGVWEFHKKVAARDLFESLRSKNRYGARFYFGLYSEERPCLSLRHAENLMRGLPFRLKREDEYDPQRVDWVRRKFVDELGPAPRRGLSI